MNTIRIVKKNIGRLDYFEIEVDGIPLAHHFSGRLGAHPSEISPLGWSTASEQVRTDTAREFIAEKPSCLSSGRVPVLVCKECGDIGCGAFTVRITKGDKYFT